MGLSNLPVQNRNVNPGLFNFNFEFDAVLQQNFNDEAFPVDNFIQKVVDFKYA